MSKSTKKSPAEAIQESPNLRAEKIANRLSRKLKGLAYVYDSATSVCEYETYRSYKPSMGHLYGVHVHCLQRVHDFELDDREDMAADLAEQLRHIANELNDLIALADAASKQKPKKNALRIAGKATPRKSGAA